MPKNERSLRPDVEEFRYPRADTANAYSTLKLVRFVLGPANQIWDCETFELMTPLRQATPVPVPSAFFPRIRVSYPDPHWICIHFT